MAVPARSAHRLVRGVGRVWLLPQGMTATTRPLVGIHLIPIGGRGGSKLGRTIGRRLWSFPGKSASRRAGGWVGAIDARTGEPPACPIDAPSHPSIGVRICLHASLEVLLPSLEV